MKDKIVNAETEEGQRAGEAIIEVVRNQLAENNPPEAQEAFDRLIAMGEPKENAMRYIASALSIEIFDALKHSKPYNKDRYIKNLKALPNLPNE